MKCELRLTKISLAIIGLFSLGFMNTIYAKEQVNIDVYNGDISKLKGSTLYGKNGNDIATHNNLLEVNFEPVSGDKNSPDTIYGGYLDSDSSSQIESYDVINTSVNLIKGRLKSSLTGSSVVGAMIKLTPMDSPIKARVEGDILVGKDFEFAEGTIDLKGAYISIGQFVTSTDIDVSAVGVVEIEKTEGKNPREFTTVYGTHVMNTNLHGRLNAEGSVIMHGGIVSKSLIGVDVRGKSVDLKGSVFMGSGSVGSRQQNGIGALGVFVGAYTISSIDAKLASEITVDGGTIYSKVEGSIGKSIKNSIEATSSIAINGGEIKGGINGVYAETNGDKGSTAKAEGEVHISGGVVDGGGPGNILVAKAKAGEHAKAKGRLLLLGGNIKSRQIFLASAEVGPKSSTGNVEPYGNAFATDSYLKIGENVVFNSQPTIWGGQASRHNVLQRDAVTGNTLDFHGKALRLSQLNNFQNYNFYLNDSNSAALNQEESLIFVSGRMFSEKGWRLNNNVKEEFQIHPTIFLKGISGKKEVEVGDHLHLLALDEKAYLGIGIDEDGEKIFLDNISEFFQESAPHDLQVGLVRKIGVVYDFDDESKRVTARFVSPEIVGEGGEEEGEGPIVDEELVDKNVKPLAEGRIAALMNITRKQRLEEPTLRDLVKGSITPFVKMQGGRDRYQSGSHITANTYDVLLGIGYRSENLSLVGFGAYGYDDYNTYNDSDEGRLKGKGHNKSFSIGISGLYDLNESFYASFGGQVGRIETKFNSQDVLTGSGENAHYKAKGTYFSGHLGLGYQHHMDEMSRLDYSAHYLYSHIGSDTVNIDGDNIHFKRLQSSKVELKTRYERDVSEYSKLSASLAYQYEFDGKGDANVAGVGINAPSMKGSTGIVGVGFEYQPTSEDPESFINRSRINMNVEGYFGKRRGGNVSLTYRYMLK